jgi:hypothetical protein
VSWLAVDSGVSLCLASFARFFKVPRLCVALKEIGVECGCPRHGDQHKEDGSPERDSGVVVCGYSSRRYSATLVEMRFYCHRLFLWHFPDPYSGCDSFVGVYEDQAVTYCMP